MMVFLPFDFWFDPIREKVANWSQVARNLKKMAALVT